MGNLTVQQITAEDRSARSLKPAPQTHIHEPGAEADGSHEVVTDGLQLY